MNEASALRERFAAVLRQHLTLLAADEPMPMQTELAELGLDSMNAINLMLDLEGEFDVAFPDSMLNAETFRSPCSLETAVRQLVEGGSA